MPNPLTANQIAQNEEAAHRYPVLRRPHQPCYADSVFMRARELAMAHCPTCGSAQRLAKTYANAKRDDAVAYIYCRSCHNWETL